MIGRGVGEPVLVTPPAVRPVLATEFRDQRRIQDDIFIKEIAEIERLIGAATQHIEIRFGLALITQTWEMPVANVVAGGLVRIPKRPLRNVMSVTLAGADDPEDLSSYSVMGVGAQFAYGSIRATTGWSTEETIIRFQAGYGDDPHDVPEVIRHAIIVAAGTWYDYREDVTSGAAHELPFSSSALMRDWRVLAVA